MNSQARPNPAAIKSTTPAAVRDTDLIGASLIAQLLASSEESMRANQFSLTALNKLSALCDKSEIKVQERSSERDGLMSTMSCVFLVRYMRAKRGRGQLRMDSLLGRDAKFIASNFLAAVVLMFFGGAACAASTSALEVRTDAGPIRGAVANGIVSFKGIPYAAPPVGENRWRQPQPTTKWTEVRDALNFGADCMQIPFPADAAPLRT
jgi:hypothetical protein